MVDALELYYMYKYRFVNDIVSTNFNHETSIRPLLETLSLADICKKCALYVKSMILVKIIVLNELITYTSIVKFCG